MGQREGEETDAREAVLGETEFWYPALVRRRSLCGLKWRCASVENEIALKQDRRIDEPREKKQDREETRRQASS